MAAGAGRRAGGGHRCGHRREPGQGGPRGGGAARRRHPGPARRRARARGDAREAEERQDDQLVSGRRRPERPDAHRGHPAGHRLRGPQLQGRGPRRLRPARRRAARPVRDQRPQDLRPRLQRHDLLRDGARPRRRARRHHRARGVAGRQPRCGRRPQARPGRHRAARPGRRGRRGQRHARPWLLPLDARHRARVRPRDGRRVPRPRRGGGARAQQHRVCREPHRQRAPRGPPGLRPLPRPHRARRRRERGHAVVDAEAAHPGRDAPDQPGRRRHELRDDAARPAPARLRPRHAVGLRRRAPCPGGGEAHDARRRRAHARPRGPAHHRRERHPAGHRRCHGRGVLGGLRLHDERPHRGRALRPHDDRPVLEAPPAHHRGLEAFRAGRRPRRHGGGGRAGGSPARRARRRHARPGRHGRRPPHGPPAVRLRPGPAQPLRRPGLPARGGARHPAGHRLRGHRAQRGRRRLRRLRQG